MDVPVAAEPTFLLELENVLYAGMAERRRLKVVGLGTQTLKDGNDSRDLVFDDGLLVEFTICCDAIDIAYRTAFSQQVNQPFRHPLLVCERAEFTDLSVL